VLVSFRCLTPVTNYIQFEMNVGRVFLFLLLATQVTSQDVCANKVASLPVSDVLYSFHKAPVACKQQLWCLSTVRIVCTKCLFVWTSLFFKDVAELVRVWTLLQALHLVFTVMGCASIVSINAL
jgi:hypothetical protein